MRSRFAVLVSLLLTFLAVQTAGAAPHPSLTINATPNPIVTGDAVLVYGQLNGPGSGQQPIVLHQRVLPAGHFKVVGSTTTNTFGFYQFTLPANTVLTNTNWSVSAPAQHVYSRTVDEGVAAALTLASSTSSADTSTPVMFTGSIAPAVVHAGERIYLQVEIGSTGDWRTITSGVIGASSAYSISHRFVVPGVYELRTAFRGDVRNRAAQSDPVSVTIQQAQNPLFTINSSNPVTDAGDAITISGMLSAAPASPATTPAPQAGVWVTLWAHHRSGEEPTPVGSTVTGSDGSYSFAVRPDHNVVYQATTTFSPPPRQASAPLFEGVRVVVSIMASATSGTIGQAVTFRGAVSPADRGHVIYLQELGKDGDFHNVATSHVNFASAYQIVWTLNSPGNEVFRTFVPGDRGNSSGHSPSVTIAATVPPPQTLARG